MFLALKIFQGGPFEVLDLNYRIEYTSHHGAKFCGDLPTELEDLVAKKINASKI